MRPLAAATLVAALALAPTTARAQDCTFRRVTPVAFGGYDVFSPAPTDSTGALAVQCTHVGEFDNIMIGMSAGNSGSVFARAMQGPFASGFFQLLYNLYKDAGMRDVWGDGISAPALGPLHAGEGVQLQFTVFGRVEPRQNVMTGPYSDNVIVTIIY